MTWNLALGQARMLSENSVLTVLKSIFGVGHLGHLGRFLPIVLTPPQETLSGGLDSGGHSTIGQKCPNRPNRPWKC